MKDGALFAGTAHVYTFPGLPGCIGMAERLVQVNVQIPAGVQPGGYLPVVLEGGDASTPCAMWIAVSGKLIRADRKLYAEGENMKSVAKRQVCQAAVLVTMLAILGTHAAWGTDNVWTSLGPDGGSISTLGIDPQNTSTVYAGTGNGVFKTTDGGASWNRGERRSARSFRCAWIDFHGVFKSIDGGASWNPAGSGCGLWG